MQEGAFVKEGTKARVGKIPVSLKVGGVIYAFYKLVPLDEKMRKLNNVRHLWEAIFMQGEYRMLMPMDSALNLSKRNHSSKHL